MKIRKELIKGDYPLLKKTFEFKETEQKQKDGTT